MIFRKRSDMHFMIQTVHASNNDPTHYSSTETESVFGDLERQASIMPTLCLTAVRKAARNRSLRSTQLYRWQMSPELCVSLEADQGLRSLMTFQSRYGTLRRDSRLSTPQRDRSRESQ
jgi:hypothetical protein